MDIKAFEKECEKRGLKVFKYDNGRQAVGVKPKSCLVCEHCSDVFWDYTNGPYMMICELEHNPVNLTCKDFKEEQ